MKRMVSLVALVALAGLALWGAAPSSIPAPPMPSQVRAQTLVVFNGVYASDASGKFVQQPMCELVLRGCEPILNADGTPKLNAYGEPSYKDTGWVGDLKLTPTQAASLMPLWQQVQTAAYNLYSANQSAVVWSKQDAPPAAN